jgi:protein BCP1
LVLGNQGEPYQFTHLIILSRVYHLSEEEESELANSAPPARSTTNGPKQNKHKKLRAQESGGEIKPAADGIYSFHPEDDIIIKVRALAYPNEQFLIPVVVCPAHIDVSFYISIAAACTRDTSERHVWT